jgi:Tol biopolymer transport system component
MTGSPQWSPDSRSLAFDSRVAGRADIYVIDVSGGSLVRITNGISNNSDNVVPSWSHDGQSLYFSSNRTGEWQVWRKSLNHGAETQVTAHGGFNGMESQDGSHLYYVHDDNQTSIWRQSLRNGKEDQVLEALDPGMWGTWTIDKNKLFFMKRRHSAGEPADIFRMDLGTGVTDTFGRAQNVVNGGISISPDGRWMTFAQNEGNSGSTIMIMDGWE